MSLPLVGKQGKSTHAPSKSISLRDSFHALGKENMLGEVSHQGTPNAKKQDASRSSSGKGSGRFEFGQFEHSHKIPKPE